MEQEGVLKMQLCLQYCPYYKPGKNEELACRGYDVVGQLLAGGKQISLSGQEKGIPPAADAVAAVRGVVCAPCAFHDEDCDFVFMGESVSPCGGFLVLAYLLEAGDITIQDLRETADTSGTTE